MTENNLLDFALKYHENGFSVVPIGNGSKAPIVSGWQRRRLSRDEIEQHFTNGHNITGIGIITGELSNNLAILDFDGKGWQAAFEHFQHSWEDDLYTAPVVETGSGKRHIYLTIPDLPPNFTNKKFKRDNAIIELRGNRSNNLAPPSLHPGGGRYRWLTPEADWPQVPFNEIHSWLSEWGTVVKESPKTRQLVLKRDGQKAPLPRRTQEFVNSPGPLPEGERNAALYAASQQFAAAGYSQNETIEELKPVGVNIGLETTEIEPTIKSGYQAAKEAGFSPITEKINHTDWGNARRLVTRHFEDIRYCYAWKSWLIWDDSRWLQDNTGEILRRAKDTIVSMYTEAANIEDEQERRALTKHALRSESLSRLTAMVALAQSEPGVSVEPDMLDVNQWLLNCDNGTLDLRTGILQPHNRADFITKKAPVSYDTGAKCPQWEKFLTEILSNNQELIYFIQKVIGYALTGDTSEQCLFILYGTGANGKSVFLETIQTMLGDDYARSTPTSTVMIKHNDNVPNDVARLTGVRMTTVNEVEDGQRLAESLIKQLTGNDTMTARFLHAEFFDFKPQFKLFVRANHKPTVFGTDEGIWRRVRLIPFTVTIPDNKQDKRLADKLQAELPGILNWAVRGCLAWQRDGLGMPLEVRRATEAYRGEMDRIGQFIEDCTETSDFATVRGGELYKAYRLWCQDNGYKPTNSTRFGRAITERGYQKDTNPYVIYGGLELTTDIHNRIAGGD